MTLRSFRHCLHEILEKSHRNERATIKENKSVIVDKEPSDENDEDTKTSKDPSDKDTTPKEDDTDLESAPEEEVAATSEKA